MSFCLWVTCAPEWTYVLFVAPNVRNADELDLRQQDEPRVQVSSRLAEIRTCRYMGGFIRLNCAGRGLSGGKSDIYRTSEYCILCLVEQSSEEGCGYRPIPREGQAFR